MTALVIKDDNTRIEEARVAACVLCALGLVARQSPTGLPFLEVDNYGGGLQITCDPSEFRAVKAAFVAVGFTVLVEDNQIGV